MAEAIKPWTGEEIASRISLDPSLLRRGETSWDAATESYTLKTISRGKAKEMLQNRIVVLLAGTDTDDTEVDVDALQAPQLANLIAASLPDEALSEAVVSALDVRPYIQLVVSEPTRTFPGDRTRQGFRLLADAWNAVQAQDIQAGAAPYRGSATAGVSPDVIATDQMAAPAAGTTASPGGSGGVYQYPVPGSNMVDLGDVAYMLRTGQADITNPDLAGQPIDMGSLPGVFTNAPNGRPRASQRELPNGRVIGRTTIGGALDWTYGLNKQEVTSLQSMLANAGYMTDMRYDAENDRWIMQDMQYEEGYANDPVFQTAWKMALQDAKANESSVGAWLTRKTSEFKQREEALRRRLTEERLGAFNSALTDVRAAADRLAMETVGRRLKPEEYVQVRQYLRSLQSDRADDTAGSTAEPWMTSDPKRGFTQDELAMQVQDVVEPEVMQRQGMSMNYQMKKWLGMD